MQRHLVSHPTFVIAEMFRAYIRTMRWEVDDMLEAAKKKDAENKEQIFVNVCYS